MIIIGTYHQYIKYLPSIQGTQCHLCHQACLVGLVHLGGLVTHEVRLAQACLVYLLDLSPLSPPKK